MLKRVLGWLEDRTGVRAAVMPIMEHPVPRTGWAYVLGSATLTAFIIQVVTGTALALAYIPSTSQAYDTLRFISNDAPFGRVLRGMHYFGASAMIVLIGLHAARVFLMGAYKYPREASWLSGVALLALTLGMGFTGQLLRWDQNAVWSVIVAAEQAGRLPGFGRTFARLILAGDTVGGATLSRFYAIHVFFIPALIFFFVALHLFLVLRNGISSPPKAGEPVDPATERARYEDHVKRDGVPFWPDAAWRDALGAFMVVLAVLVLALIFGPPLLDRPPDPSNIDASPRPDWYLLWYFAVLSLLPNGSEGPVIVLGPLLFFVVMALLPFLFRGGERSARRRPWAVAAMAVVVIIISVFWIQGAEAPWSPDFAAKPLPDDVVRSQDAAVRAGAVLFHDKACLYCHQIEGRGGRRGPDLSALAERLSRDQMIWRILNGGNNMPAFGGNMTPQEMDALVAFLETRGRTPTPPH